MTKRRFDWTDGLDLTCHSHSQVLRSLVHAGATSQPQHSGAAEISPNYHDRTKGWHVRVRSIGR